MSVKIEKQENSKVVLEFKIEKEKFHEALDEAFKKNSKHFKIQGFRAGKVPRNVVEKTYGEGVLYDEAFNIIAGKEYENAVEENNLEVVARPEVDIKEIGKDKDLEFTITVYVKPEVEIKDYKGLNIKKVSEEISEEDLQKELENVQSKNARIITLEDATVENKDLTVIDFEGFLDGVPFDGGKAEKYELEIGSGSFIPGFEEQLIGMKVGEEKDINSKFPEEYHSKELAGKDTIFKVKLHEIKRKELPNLDDEFAKDVSEFDTFEEYKKSVKERLIESRKKMAVAERENQVIEKLAEMVTITIPEPMIESQIDTTIQNFEANLSYQGINLEQYMQMINTDMEGLRGQFRENALKEIKTKLAMESVSKQEKFDASAEEIDSKIEELSTQYGQGDAASLKSNENARNYMQERIKEEKLLKFLVENAIEK
ncbi:MAG: trigger factor [Clostridia bacterium]|nr:trigger factor [Clostridia bacterium]MDD4375739.1 trigger factor [Clostridia bacterium]